MEADAVPMLREEPGRGAEAARTDLELTYDMQQLQSKLELESTRNGALRDEVARLQRTLISASRQLGLIQAALRDEVLVPKRTRFNQAVQLGRQTAAVQHACHEALTGATEEGSGWGGESGEGGGESLDGLSLEASDPAVQAQAVESALTAIAAVGARSGLEGGAPVFVKSTTAVLKDRLRAAALMRTDVLSQPALLHRVFACLGPRELGRASCVCREWRALPLRADLALWRRLSRDGAVQPLSRGPLWEGILLSASSRSPDTDVFWPVSTLLELAAVGEAMDMQSLGGGGRKGRQPLRGRTLLKLYALQVEQLRHEEDRACFHGCASPSPPDDAAPLPLSLQVRSGHVYPCAEQRVRLGKMPRPQALSLDPSTDGTPHSAGAPMSARLYSKYLSSGRANEKAAVCVRNVKDAAAGVRAARAALAQATETLNAYAERGEPLPADMTVEFASTHEECQRVEAAFVKAEAEARSAVAASNASAQSADLALVAAFLDARRQHALAVGRAWTAACRAPSHSGGTVLLTDPVTGKVVPTAGLRLPRLQGPGGGDATAGGQSGGARGTAVSRALPASILDMVNRALDRGNLTATAQPDIGPLFPLPARLARMLHDTAVLDADPSEEERLGLLHVPVPPPPPESTGEGGATLHSSTPAAAPSLIKLDDGEAHEGGKSVVEIPAPPFTSQHLLIDADVRRTFGDIDAALRAAEAMTGGGGDEGVSPRTALSVILPAETLLPTSNVTCPSTPQGVRGITREVLEGLRVRLRNVLLAYAAFDRGSGYCQGQNFLAAMLLRHMSEPASFWGVAALCHSPVYALADAFSHGLYRTGLSFAHLSSLLSVHRPRLASHLGRQGVTTDMYATSWVMTLWAGCWDTLPLTHVSAVWDAFLTCGWKVQARVSLALLDAVGTGLEEGDLGTIVEMLHAMPQDKLPPTPAGLLRRAFKFKVTNGQLARMSVKYDQLTHGGRGGGGGRGGARKDSQSLLHTGEEGAVHVGGPEPLGEDSVYESAVSPEGGGASSYTSSSSTGEAAGWGEAHSGSGYTVLGGGGKAGGSGGGVVGALGSLGIALPSVTSMPSMAAAFNALTGRGRSLTLNGIDEGMTPASGGGGGGGAGGGAQRSRTSSAVDPPVPGRRSRAASNAEEGGGGVRRTTTLEAAQLRGPLAEADTYAESAEAGQDYEPDSGSAAEQSPVVLTSSLSAFVLGGVSAPPTQPAGMREAAEADTLEPRRSAHALALSTPWFGSVSQSGRSTSSPGSPTLSASVPGGGPLTAWATFASPSGVEAAFTSSGTTALGAPASAAASPTNVPLPRGSASAAASRPAGTLSPGEFGDFAHATPPAEGGTRGGMVEAREHVGVEDGHAAEAGAGGAPELGDGRGDGAGEWEEDGGEGVAEGSSASAPRGMAGLAGKLRGMLSKAGNSLSANL